MSDSTYYYFFDRDGIDPIWHMTWHEFFRRFPSLRDMACSVLRQNCMGSDGEITETELQKLLHKTLAWTLRRNTPQMVMMSDIMPEMIAGKRQAVGVADFPLGDFTGLLGQATADFLSGRLHRLAYEAVLKLHNIVRPSNWLTLSKKDAMRVVDLVPEDKLTRPIYRWQGPGACRETPTGLWIDDVANCLNVVDTERFCMFIESSWKRNEPVQNIIHLGETSTGDGEKDAPRFRDFDVNQKLIKAVRSARRMLKPVVMRFMT